MPHVQPCARYISITINLMCDHCGWHFHHHQRAHKLEFTHFNGKRIHHMTSTMLPSSKASTTVSPVKAEGSPSTATLGPITFTLSDSTIATVANDPANPLGAIVTSTSVTGTTILTGTAVATEPDGTTTETVVGSLTVIVATPPPAPAAALVFTPLIPIA